MKKTILILCLLGSTLFAKSQTVLVDTNQLKRNIETLNSARNVIFERKDISIKDALPLVNGLTQLMQSDADLLQFERNKKKQAAKKQ